MIAQTADVREAHRFDVAALQRYMRAHVEGFSGPLEVRQFRGGQSNPTYHVSAGGREYVLRRKPPGKLLPSAHAVDREYRVMTALAAAGFPVPRTFALCEDEAVIGTAFYVMDCVHGRIFTEPALPGIEPRSNAGDLRRHDRGAGARCTPSTGRRSASLTSGGRATTSRARSTAGPSSTAPRRPRRSSRWSG